MWQFLRDDAMGYAKVSGKRESKALLPRRRSLADSVLRFLLRRNDGEGNSCGMTLRAIQRSSSATKTRPLQGASQGVKMAPFHTHYMERSFGGVYVKVLSVPLYAPILIPPWQALRRVSMADSSARWLVMGLSGCGTFSIVNREGPAPAPRVYLVDIALSLRIGDDPHLGPLRPYPGQAEH